MIYETSLLDAEEVRVLTRQPHWRLLVMRILMILGLVSWRRWH